MAFDVYVGTLTRFYRREWENIVQQAAKAQGTQYRMIYAVGEPEPPPPADEIHQAVTGWCQAMSGGLQPHGFGPIVWDESDSQPYFTDRPAWDGYSSLLLFAAHAEHPDLPMPTKVSQSWVEDEAFQRSTVKEFKTRFRSILEPALWLPTEFPFVFEGPTLTEEKSTIGSTFTLKKQLDDLHAQTKDLLATARPLDEKTAGDPSFLQMANLGVEIFRALAGKACEHRLPILLSF